MAILPTTGPSADPTTWTIQTFFNTNDGGILHNVLVVLTDTAGTVAAIFIVIGAFQYLTAYGSEEKSEAGKKTLTWAIIGLVVIILARVLLGTLWRFLTTETIRF